MAPKVPIKVAPPLPIVRKPVVGPVVGTPVKRGAKPVPMPAPIPSGPKGQTGPRSPQQTREATVAATEGPIPVLYGKQRLGGRIFYVNTYQGSLYLAVAFCEGPVNSITAAEVRVDGETLTAVAGKGWVPSYNLHDGGLSQSVDSLLSAAFSYTQTHPGLCYAVLKISGTAPWGALPEITAVIEGLKLYDPRDATTVYKRNPSLMARDVLTRFAGQVTADFDDPSVNAAANYYDATIDSEPRYALDLALVSQGSVDEWLANIKAHCGLDVFIDQGVWCFFADQTLASPVALTDAHLADVRISRKDTEDTPTRVLLL